MTPDQSIRDKTDKVTVLIVDDEAHARGRIRQLLSENELIEVAGEAKDGIDALQQIQELQPQIVFLDIQMPGMDGFDVVRDLPDHLHPAIVFVTAFDEYAIKAFEVNATDYVLKPIDRLRFDAALARAIDSTSKSVDEQDDEDSHLQQAALVDAPDAGNQRILVKTQGVYRIVEVAQILWIEAADKYVRLHCGEKVFTCRHTMRDLENKLDANSFARIHRSSIVNINAILEIQPHFHGDFKVVLTDKTVLTLSRSYRAAFEAKFQNKL